MGRAGATLALSARDQESLDDVQEELKQLGIAALAVGCDVGDPDSMQALGDQVLSAFGRIDVVVANAGIAGPTRMLHEIEPEEWQRCIDIDLTGVYLTFRPFIPAMIAQRTGALIAVSSMTGKRPLWGRTPYSAAKMGVIGLVRTLALELDQFGVRVNAVCPGPVEGPRIESVIRAQAEARGLDPDLVRRELMAPASRLVSQQEVAAACVFLASDLASGITGEDLNVSAGAVY
jgi:NAD(P)-dependent dehydrogenase (short-subunit alcohol dehydrogenase family)